MSSVNYKNKDEYQLLRRIYIQIRMLPLNRALALLRKWAFVMLILFALNAFSLNLGYGSPIFSRLCGFLSLIWAIFLYGNVYGRIFDKKAFALGSILISISLEGFEKPLYGKAYILLIL